LADIGQNRLRGDPGGAEIACKHGANILDVLVVDRLIEAQALTHLDDALGGGEGASEQVARISWE
jgi:hypothetical protein